MEELAHYGTPRHSGRYPYGSGKDPYQHSGSSLLRAINGLKKDNPGISDKDIAHALGMSTTEYRRRRSIAKEEKRAADLAEALHLRDDCNMNTSDIARQMGKNESSIRSMLDPSRQQRLSVRKAISDTLEERISNSDYVDIGLGSEAYLGVSRTKLLTAVKALEDKGYKVYYDEVRQMGTGKPTSLMVLAKKDSEWVDMHNNIDKISMIKDVKINDDGTTARGIKPPQSISSDRVKVRYAEDGGTEMDGVMLIRRNVPDLSLGNSRYAQVRIAVDDTHYLKGMAMYSDDIPKGYDIVFNTNKSKGTPAISKDGGPEVFKKLKADPDNPFGATIKVGGQSEYTDASGKRRLSAINKLSEEGDWDTWSRTLSSQFLSKQRPELAKQQLALDFAHRKDDYDQISKIKNPVVRKKLLSEFADECDSAAVHLKAAALPRQQAQVILPVPGLKDNEIYAPNFRNGETVALIRHPHGGTFEIPELKVNNKAPAAMKLFERKDGKGTLKDAVGINSKVAERLSGADFDGDTVIVIPSPKISRSDRLVKSTPPLKGLIDFDPKTRYAAYEGMPKVGPKTGFHKQQQMGSVSNLITDMTIKGASDTEIAAAVRHSMVVIDAEKHNLNWRQSAIDNGIPALKEKYQGGKNAGASTLLSRASSEARINGVRKDGVYIVDPKTGKGKRHYIDPKTGEKLYEYIPESYINKSGNRVDRTTKTTKMAVAKDARTLSSGEAVEELYAGYANGLKSLGNQARKDTLLIPTPHVDPQAKARYSTEVSSLDAKLRTAMKNKPLERQAQLYANTQYKIRVKDNPSIKDDPDSCKRLKTQLLAGGRARYGSSQKDRRIFLTDKEWEAIDSGAISSNKLKQILDNTDPDRVRELATPKQKTVLSDARIARIKAMAASNYTQAEIAEQIGISPSTVRKALV